MVNKLKVFEMFAGFGGTSFALKKGGIEFESIGFSEIDKNAIKIYEHNHPGVKNYGNCREIKIGELPDFDLLTGGFPCQPFSVNTNQEARGETHKSYNLFEDIIRIVEGKRPEYVLLENVKGILGDKAKEVYETIIRELIMLGYGVQVKLMNSRKHGTPQNRERVYFICKLGGWKKEIDLQEEELKLSVIDILEKNPRRREPSIMKYDLKKKKNIEKYGNITRYEAILLNKVDKKNSNVLFEILDAPSDVVSRQCDRIYKPTYSPCLTATGRDYVFYLYNKTIVLTPRECFRLMGFFKDEIKFPENVSDSQKYKLAGNGLDINLVSKIFEWMFEDIIKPVKWYKKLKIIFKMVSKK